MSLYSLAYVLFFSLLAAAYYAVGRFFGRGQWVVLLAGSLVFYCIMGSWQTLVYVLVTAGVTWLAPLVFQRMDAACKEERSQVKGRAQKKAVKVVWQRRRRWVLVAALLVVFGILAYLKYWNVILFQLRAAPSPTSLGLVLPLGISFYTFQSVGYLIDAYNGAFEPERNFLHHLLFVTFFPQMIQGPINRYEALAPQLFSRHSLADVKVEWSLLHIGYGMLKKFVMADLLVELIELILSSVGIATPGSLIAFAILMYSAQQYGDFSGGIDMVEGFSELLGIEMAPNFRRPYFSVSLGDFWRRWHMSLGAWMRDYVFYPVALTRPMKALSKWAGARYGRHAGRTLPACVANILVFLLVGIWHGAETHFIVWGLYNGLVIALSDLLSPALGRLAERLHVDVESRGFHLFEIARTFLIVNIGWYFDRIENFGASIICLWKTFFDFAPQRFASTFFALGIGHGKMAQLLLALIAALVVFAVSVMQERGVDVSDRLLKSPLLVRAMVCLFVGFLIVASFTFNTGGGFMYANY